MSKNVNLNIGFTRNNRKCKLRVLIEQSWHEKCAEENEFWVDYLFNIFADLSIKNWLKKNFECHFHKNMTEVIH